MFAPEDLHTSNDRARRRWSNPGDGREDDAFARRKVVTRTLSVPYHVGDFVEGFRLTGRGEQTIVEALGLRTVDPARILIADARDVDREEGVELAGSGVRVTTVDRIAQEIPADLPIYVHLDVDVVTPSEMPALRFPARGGFAGRRPGLAPRQRCSADRPFSGRALSRLSPLRRPDGVSVSYPAAAARSGTPLSVSRSFPAALWVLAMRT